MPANVKDAQFADWPAGNSEMASLIRWSVSRARGYVFEFGMRTIRKPGRRVRFTVADTGSGMSRAILQRMWSRFSRPKWLPEQDWACGSLRRSFASITDRYRFLPVQNVAITEVSSLYFFRTWEIAWHDLPGCASRANPHGTIL